MLHEPKPIPSAIDHVLDAYDDARADVAGRWRWAVVHDREEAKRDGDTRTPRAALHQAIEERDAHGAWVALRKWHDGWLQRIERHEEAFPIWHPNGEPLDEHEAAEPEPQGEPPRKAKGAIRTDDGEELEAPPWMK